MSKALAGLGLPPRPVAPARELAPWTHVTPVALRLGQGIAGSLDEPDARLENGARVDDYAIDLVAGQRIAVDLQGGRSLTEPCCTLDVLTELRAPDGSVVTSDDDGAGGFDSRLETTATAPGRYVVRVSTSGSGDKRGPYTLQVSAL